VAGSGNGRLLPWSNGVQVAHAARVRPTPTRRSMGGCQWAAKTEKRVIFAVFPTGPQRWGQRWGGLPGGCVRRKTLQRRPDCVPAVRGVLPEPEKTHVNQCNVERTAMTVHFLRLSLRSRPWVVHSSGAQLQLWCAR
jgi:hypothetical protein